MKKYRKGKELTAILLAVIMAITIIPSAGVRTTAAKTTNSITVGAVNTGKLTIAAKSSYKLEAKAKTGKLTYKSSKAGVAKVTKKGVIKAVKPGKATITIKGKNASKKIKVTVVKKNKYKKVKKIKLKSPPKKMFASDSKKLAITFNPAKASNKNLKFKSSRKSVATVNEKGIIQAIKPGTAKITITSCANKKAKASFTLTVVEDTRHVVTFDSLGGSAVPAQKVENGKKAKKPAEPVMAGATFGGWYLEEEENAFDFNQPITASITLHAKWDVKLSNITKDGEVDSGDLALLEAAGKVEVKGDGDSNAPRAIIGTFTDKKVTGKASAVAVLKSLESVFNQAVTPEGDLVETDFEVKEDEINTEEIDTPADGTGKDAPKEYFYKYFPEISTSDGTIPVEGAEIILCTDANGTVTGLHSTYDAAFRTVAPYTYSETDEAMAKRAATSYIRQKTNDDGSYLLPPVISVSLNTEAELVLYTGKDAEEQSPAVAETEAAPSMPFYAYKVRVYTGEAPQDTSKYDPDEDPTLDDNRPVGEEGDSNVVMGSTPETEADPAISIDWTVYVNPLAFKDQTIQRVHHAMDNHHTDSWSATTQNLPCLNGSIQKIDMRQKGSGNNAQYEYYNKSRKISVLQAKKYNSATDSYGPEDKSRTEALVTRNPQNCPTANTILYHAEKVYDYYRDVLGRKGYDDKKSNLFVCYYADYYKGSVNSYWDGGNKKIFITLPRDGVNYARCLDVLGHEFTHGVNSYRVGNGKGLEYKNESGALDEAYADIMGESIEGKIKDGNWLHAEDKSGYNTSNPNRDLENPERGHYNQRYTGTKDNGGVHTNSTIFSHAYYLMATDSRIKGQVSFDRWAQLFYRSLSRLSYTSKFVDARHAVLAEAQSMKFTGLQQKVISEAYDAVGITDPEEMTLTLTWGNKVKDLDLILVGPDGKSYFTVFYNNKCFTKKNKLVASLVKDDTGYSGTEVIKIHNLENGTYYCLVRYHSPEGDDSSSTAMGQSKAHVVANHKSYTKPRNYYAYSNAKGTYWLACQIEVKKGVPNSTRFTQDFADGPDSLYRYGGIDLLKAVYSQY